MADKYLKQLKKYVDKVYDFSGFLHQYSDSRVDATIPSWVGLMLGIVGIWMRIASLNQMEELVNRGAFDNLLGKSVWRPSADTASRIFIGADHASLEAYGAYIDRRNRRNQNDPAEGTFNGLRVSAVDLTETFCTNRPTKEVRKHWKIRTVTKADGSKELQYYEQAVVVSRIGGPKNLITGIERVPRGDGESTTALALLRKMDVLYGPTWTDVLVFDAYYAMAPVINYAIRTNKDVVIRLKQANYHIAKDVDGLTKNKAPDAELVDEHLTGADGKKYRYQAKIWDVNHLTSWDGVDQPLRCLKVWEQREKRENGEWVKDEPYVSYIITTLDESLVPARIVWLILHKRWDIESAFNDLKNNWAFSHCCCRHPNAIKTVYLLFMIAYNLLALFHRNHLWWDKDLHRTTLSKLLLIGLLSITKPWRPRAHGRQPIRYVGNLALPAT